MLRLPRDYDWLIVGAGLTGASFARCLADNSTARVLVVEQRPRIAGNVFDAISDHGVQLPQHGAHIFHASSGATVDFLSRFTEWHPYQHRVLASVDDQLMPVPFNFTSLEMLLPAAAQQLQRELLAAFPSGARVGIASLRASDQPGVREFAEFLLDQIFHDYTAKQWGLPPAELDRAVLDRVPITMSHDDRYFRDDFQAVPSDGYTALVRRMLDHPSITVALEVDGAAEIRRRRPAHALWTGGLDAYFDYEFGPLPYRSLRFEHTATPRWRELPAAVINHPHDEAFTSIVDHSYFGTEPHDGTVLTREYPATYRADDGEPYFPVLNDSSRQVHAEYANRAAGTDVLLAGWLSDFRYHDMHQAVARAMTLAETVLQSRIEPPIAARATRSARPYRSAQPYRSARAS